LHWAWWRILTKVYAEGVKGLLKLLLHTVVCPCADDPSILIFGAWLYEVAGAAEYRVLESVPYVQLTSKLPRLPLLLLFLGVAFHFHKSPQLWVIFSFSMVASLLLYFAIFHWVLAKKADLDNRADPDVAADHGQLKKTFWQYEEIDRDLLKWALGALGI